ncbi:magnesium transporter [Allofustis seminis]|uniref:magnesium transporter n=1 Tax=Allofustis seminis TaxID=166939 RepID=UPI0003658338|nr:magnesium transporter [Allofustis seminis]
MEQTFIEQEYLDAIYKAAKQNDREKFRDLFLKLHTNDQLEAYKLLYPESKAKITQFLLPPEFAEIFDIMETDERLETLEHLPDKYVLDTLEFVSDDNVVDFLRSLDEETATKIIAKMDEEDRHPIERLLLHKEKTAGAIMTTEFIVAHRDDSVDSILEQARQIGREAEMIYYIYVLDDAGKLEGVVSLRDLILAPTQSAVKDIMNTQVVNVHPETNQRMVTYLIREYDLLAIPVIDKNDVMLGIVTVDDILEIMGIESITDLQRMSGILIPDDVTAEELRDETVIEMTKSRLPWIIILLFLGLISANVISRFEGVLSQVVALAAFMPIIMDTAGNVGTQALAVSIRRLTQQDQDGPGIITLLLKEFLTGVLMGIASGIVMFGISYVIYQNHILSLVVGLAIAVTISISCVIGYIIPGLFSRFGIDPAVSSGPFVTTINDTFGLFTYFTMATLVLHLL